MGHFRCIVRATQFIRHSFFQVTGYDCKSMNTLKINFSVFVFMAAALLYQSAYAQPKNTIDSAPQILKILKDHQFSETGVALAAQEGIIRVDAFLSVAAIKAQENGILAITTLVDPSELHSPGAIVFLLAGWAFLVISLIGFIKGLNTIYQKIRIDPLLKYFTLIASVACCLIAAYLLYWNIIGLTLRSY